MDKRLFDGTVCFEHVTGVGTMEVDFQPNQRVYTMIGENGVGKTKFLECLFTVLLFTNSSALEKDHYINVNKLPFKKVESLIFTQKFDENEACHIKLEGRTFFSGYTHDLPIVYLAAQNRGGIKYTHSAIPELEKHEKQMEKYLDGLFDIFWNDHAEENFKNLNMNTNVKEWVIQRANSANQFQAKEDNRQIELEVLVSLLNKIDSRIDEKFLEKSGYEVFIKVGGERRELSDLSSGFTSIVKIIQSIIAGYSYFTNKEQIAEIDGVVLIDEIESHLHNEWQIKIVPLLKKLFPNTTFFITTHSSLVISQLEQGEAYRLVRSKEDGVVYGKMIDYPSNASFVDLLNEAFGVDLNKKKIERAQERNQEQAKKALLELVRQELGGLGDK